MMIMSTESASLLFSRNSRIFIRACFVIMLRHWHDMMTRCTNFHVRHELLLLLHLCTICLQFSRDNLRCLINVRQELVKIRHAQSLSFGCTLIIIQSLMMLMVASLKYNMILYVRTSMNFATHRSVHTASPLFRSPSAYLLLMHF
jgi:hypothetical protein